MKNLDKIRGRFTGHSDEQILIILEERLAAAYRENQDNLKKLEKIKTAWRNGGGLMLVEAIKELGEK